MAQAALDYFCFAPDQVKLLIGDDAKKKSLIDILSGLADPISIPLELTRLFIYISAHGGRKDGIQLDYGLDWEEFRQLVEKINAKQTFVFIDTCNSNVFIESRTGEPRTSGDSTYLAVESEINKASFYLTAAEGRAWESYALRSGHATSNFLALISGLGDLNNDGRITSLEICSSHLDGVQKGKCQQEYIGDTGVILVQKQGKTGSFEIENPGLGYWNYAFAQVRGETEQPYQRLKTVNTHGDQKPKQFSVGAYQIRRISFSKSNCTAEFQHFEIHAEEMTSLKEQDWRPARGLCRELRREQHRVQDEESSRLLLSELGLASSWFEHANTARRLRLGLLLSSKDQMDESLPRYFGLKAQLASLPEDESIAPASVRREVLDLALLLSGDQLIAHFSGLLDLSLGLELGLSWAQVGSSRSDKSAADFSGLAASSLGAIFALESGWQVRISFQAGGRLYLMKEELQLAPSLGLLAGLAYAL